MPRTYTVGFDGVSVAAAQDLLQIKGAASKVLLIKRVWLGATPTTLATAQGLRLRCRYLPATVTDGSGGTTPTPQPLSPGDAAASFTALANNTTPATSSGTARLLYPWGEHIYNGENWVFPKPPEIIASTSFVFELLAAPSASVGMSGGCEIEEYG